ncbi:MAG: GNAT family N-acetyltransferase [Candidatus Cloacimonetes bacterium]|jgi:RimJ/RimL family protein N-acetyltransferase|nr:GNAT family N-acetyltransferase [Candidatus Cloacimonadota bacterium]
MKYFRKLVGQRCYLSPISLEDAERYTEWVNDMEIGQFVMFSTAIFDLDKEREALQRLMRESVSFAIVEKDNNKAVGNCSLMGISDVHRHAQFGIFIGDKTYWNQGIGTEATALILDYGFNILNLQNISLEVFGFNKRAIRCYEKVGFKFVGQRRDYIFMAGQYHDVMIYDILAKEFSSPYVNDIFERSTSEDAGRDKIAFE